LIDDEVRHHRLFNELADSLETEALMKGVEPDIPYLDFQRADRGGVLEGFSLDPASRHIRRLARPVQSPALP
jgi:hypothetical protein